MHLVPEALERRLCLDSAGWSMYGYDATGSRDNTAEQTLSPANVGQLGVAWRYPTSAPVYSTPAVVGGSVYAGDYIGNVYSVNESNGTLNWEVNVGSSVTDSILVTDNTVIFGDQAGNVWGLNATTGATIWEVQPNTTSPYGAVYGSATMIGNDVAIAFASNEESIPGLTTYDENGSVALLDPANGQVIWQTYTIPQGAYNDGWRGAGIWSTPTYDQATNTIYVGTGNYYQAGTSTDPGVEDAVIALNAMTGAVLWTDQLVKDDVWNGNIVPCPANPDADLADSAKIFTLPSGETAIGIGSKDGVYFVMDAATGAPINGPDGLPLEAGGSLGGLFATGAVDQQAGIVFQNGLDWPTAGENTSAPRRWWRHATPFPSTGTPNSGISRPRLRTARAWRSPTVSSTSCPSTAPCTH